MVFFLFFFFSVSLMRHSIIFQFPHYSQDRDLCFFNRLLLMSFLRCILWQSHVLRCIEPHISHEVCSLPWTSWKILEQELSAWVAAGCSAGSAWVQGSLLSGISASNNLAVARQVESKEKDLKKHIFSFGLEDDSQYRRTCKNMVEKLEFGPC